MSIFLRFGLWMNGVTGEQADRIVYFNKTGKLAPDTSSARLRRDVLSAIAKYGNDPLCDSIMAALDAEQREWEKWRTKQ